MAQDRAKEGVRLPYVLRHFDVSYLGICAPHVWIYCVAHRAGLDFGGVVIGIREELDIPIKYIGVGEQIDDLRPFDPVEFANALFQNTEDKDRNEQEEA